MNIASQRVWTLRNEVCDRGDIMADEDLGNFHWPVASTALFNAQYQSLKIPIMSIPLLSRVESTLGFLIHYGHGYSGHWTTLFADSTLNKTLEIDSARNSLQTLFQESDMSSTVNRIYGTNEVKVFVVFQKNTERNIKETVDQTLLAEQDRLNDAKEQLPRWLRFYIEHQVGMEAGYFHARL